VPFDATRTLANMLTDARYNDCGCNVCIELRATWTYLEVPTPEHERAQDMPPPGNVCDTCWQAPALDGARRGGVGVATARATAGRCSMCGMPT
jgi:hypothetical protein